MNQRASVFPKNKYFNRKIKKNWGGKWKFLNKLIINKKLQGLWCSKIYIQIKKISCKEIRNILKEKPLIEKLFVMSRLSLS